MISREEFAELLNDLAIGNDGDAMDYALIRNNVGRGRRSAVSRICLATHGFSTREFCEFIGIEGSARPPIVSKSSR